MLRSLGTMLNSPLLWMLAGMALAAAVWMYIQRKKRIRRQSVMLATGLRDIGEMAVEEVRCTLVHSKKELRRFFGKELPLEREWRIYKVDVVVRIGFDFDAIDVHVDNAHRRIELHLPKMRVLSTSVDFESRSVLMEKTGLFVRQRMEDCLEEMQHLTHEAEEKARAFGAFERAQISAQTRLEAFVGKLYDLTVYELAVIPACSPKTEDDLPSAC